MTTTILASLCAPLCTLCVEASGGDLATAQAPSRDDGAAKSAPWSGFGRGMGLGGWLTNYKRFNSLPQKWRLDITRGDLEHFDSYITERDVENIKSMGFDHVRLGFDQIVLEEEPGKWREGIFGKLREFVGWCDRHGLNVVLNLHKAVGNYCDIKEEVSLLDDEGLQRRFINLWLELESRFSDAPGVAFELMNEVRDIDPAKWNDLADRTIRAIRERNPNRWIVVGPTRWNAPDKLGVLKVWDDPKVVYTFHVYEPFEFTHQRGVLQAPALYPNMVLEYPCTDIGRYRECRRLGWDEEDAYPDDAAVDKAFMERELRGASDFVAAHPGKILWLGEFGTIRHAPPASRVAWMRDVVSFCKERGIPWCVWNYLSTPNDGNRFSLVDDDTREFLSPELLAACLGAGAPSAAHTLYLAGASTLDEHGGDESRWASWGSSLRPFLREGCAIVNYGRSGRSTTSFIREGWWGKIGDALAPGDFVVIQFGHNDQKLDKPDVATPIPQYRENLRRMAADVRAKGATPVFATPIVRLTYGKDGLLTDAPRLDDWAEAMREVAKEEGVDLVDMREMTRKVANEAGEAEALTWHATGDRTHPAVKGARLYAQLFLADVKKRGLAVAGLFVDVAATTPGVAVSVVEKRPGYNSWPMIQAIGDTLVCAYGRGKGHFVESSRGAYARTSSDGGRTWSPEVCIANDPVICEGVEGAGLDSSGAALFWMNCRGKGHIRHELCRTEDGVTFTKIAAPEMSPEPIQVTDIFTVPGVGLMSLWFTGDYGSGEPCNSWGTLVSHDDGKIWTQRTVESGLPKAEWPTEPSAVVLPDGRILAIARTEMAGAGQLQLLSADGGATWTKYRTNITDVRASTPSLVLDTERGLVHCYYYERGPGLLKRRTARVADILADPATWPEPGVLAIGGRVRSYDSGNANATASGNRHFVAWYTGDPTNAAVVVTAADAPANLTTATP